jgi:hypothetical protein
MKRVIPFGIVLSAFGMLTASASAAGNISASATIYAVPDGSNFDYTMTLKNTGGVGSDSIATFWFAWVPGGNQNFLLTSPSNLLSAHPGLIISEFLFTSVDGSLRPAIRLPAGGRLAHRPGATAGPLLG